LPAVDESVFGNHGDIAALGERRSFGDGDGLGSAGGDAFTSESIGGSETPSAVGEDADADADGFRLGESANRAIFGSEIALPLMHEASVGVSSTAEFGGV
jgi:hypothetical protein